MSEQDLPSAQAYRAGDASKNQTYEEAFEPEREKLARNTEELAANFALSR